MRVQWKAAIKTAECITRSSSRKRSGRAKRGTEAGEEAADNFQRNPEAGNEQVCERQLQEQRPVLAELVELPFLRLLWGVHGTTTGMDPTGAMAGDSFGDGVEPSELKYLGGTLRQVLTGGGATRRVQGREVRRWKD